MSDPRLTAAQPMVFAYADPPYLGQGARHYTKHHPDAAEWDSIERHRQLIAQLAHEFPDGWAMSLSAPSLRQIWPLCPDRSRVAVWCKTFSAFKKGVRPAYAWEPVIFVGGRNKNHPPPVKGGQQTTPKDFFEWNDPHCLLSPIALQRGLVGAKPAAVCRWILSLLNVQAGDTVIDLFPGTGIMATVAEEVTLPTFEEI